MFDAPIGGPANIFIWIVVFLIAFVAAILNVDLFKIYGKKSGDKNKKSH